MNRPLGNTDCRRGPWAPSYTTVNWQADKRTWIISLIDWHLLVVLSCN